MALLPLVRVGPCLVFFLLNFLLNELVSNCLGYSFSHTKLHPNRRSHHRYFAHPSRLLNSSGKDDILLWEQDVKESVAEKLDKKIVYTLLSDNSPDPSERPTWAIPAASAVTSSMLAFVLFHNSIFTVGVLMFTFLAAYRDPLESDDFTGALARLLGRYTLRSVDASTPVVKAVTRTLVTGKEELATLKQRIAELENENDQLRLWKSRRQYVDNSLTRYSLDELKSLARDAGVRIGGTKSDLLLRLVESGIIEITVDSSEAIATGPSI
jgi:hypothetical protein